MSSIHSAAESRGVQILRDQAERVFRARSSRVADQCLRSAIVEHTSVDSRVQLARFLLRLGQLDSAEIVLDEAWQSSRCASDVSRRALCCRELSILHRMSGRFDQAARFRQLAVEAELQEQGAPTGVSLWLAACEAGTAGRNDDAEALLDASAHCALPARPADILAERGRLCRHENDFPSAIAHLRRSARLLIRENDQFTAGVVLEELGRTCCDDQRFRAAAKMLNRAAKLFRRLGCATDTRRTSIAVREANRRRKVLQVAADRN